MLRRLTFTILLAAAAPAAAQDRTQTLADIRQDLTVLYVEVQRLKRELSTTGAPGVALQGTSALERIDSIEAELQRLTARTEELTNRVDRVVTDGTNRIGDLEFRLVELEGGDVSKLGQTTTLGGGEAPAVAGGAIAGGTAAGGAPVIERQPESGPLLAVGEQADFDKAKAAYDAGSYEAAAGQFEAFAATYTGGALTIEAHFWRGKALAALGNPSAAAKAFLEAYSGDPDGMIAPDALLELGLSLDSLGASEEACTMLGELTAKFPGTPASEEARAAQGQIGCV